MDRTYQSEGHTERKQLFLKIKLSAFSQHPEHQLPLHLLNQPNCEVLSGLGGLTLRAILYFKHSSNQARYLQAILSSLAVFISLNIGGLKLAYLLVHNYTSEIPHFSCWSLSLLTFKAQINSPDIFGAQIL